MKLLPAIVTTFLLVAAAPKLEAAEQQANLRDPALVIQGYLRATYARDYIAAYSYIETMPPQKQLAPNRIQAVTKIGIPEPAQFFNLDPRRLNAMSVDERRQVIESWEKKKRDGSFEMIEIEEKLELVKEGDEWRIFLNWAAGVKIPFRLALANAADLDV